MRLRFECFNRFYLRLEFEKQTCTADTLTSQIKHSHATHITQITQFNMKIILSISAFSEENIIGHRFV